MASEKRKGQIKGVLILLLTAFIWGTSFVAQGIGAQRVETFTFIALRTLLGSVVLLPVIAVRRRQRPSQAGNATRLLRSGALLGVVLALATNLQQEAFKYMTPGKVAFITSAYMLMVPVMRRLGGEKIRSFAWLGAIIGTVGLYLLCMAGKSNSAIGKGDVLALGCAAFFAIHIIFMEKFVKECDPIELSSVQFAIAGAISAVPMLTLEHPTLQAIGDSAFPLFYCGAISCGVAYTLQAVGQKHCDSTPASLAMCTESVFAALSSAIIVSERMTGLETAGCVLMLFAVMMSAVFA